MMARDQIHEQLNALVKGDGKLLRMNQICDTGGPDMAVSAA